MGFYVQPDPAEVVVTPTINRSTDPSYGDAFPANWPNWSLPAGILTAAAKTALLAQIDNVLGSFPANYEVYPDGSLEIENSPLWEGIPQDPRAGAPTLDPVATQAKYRAPSGDMAYGGKPFPFIDWDRIPAPDLQKFYQLWVGLRTVIANN